MKKLSAFLASIFLAVGLITPIHAEGTTAYVSSTEELKVAFQDPNVSEIVVDQSFSLTEVLILQDRTVHLNMNGQTITSDAPDTSSDAGDIQLNGSANLTVDGNGTFTYNTDPNGNFIQTSGEGGYVFRAYDNSTLTLVNGTYHAFGTVAQAGDNAKIVVKSGSFSVDADWGGKVWVLNKIDNSNTTIQVITGTFENFDPSNSDTENPSDSFIDVNSTVSQSGTTYTVSHRHKYVNGYCTCGEPFISVDEEVDAGTDVGTSEETTESMLTGMIINAANSTLVDGISEELAFNIKTAAESGNSVEATVKVENIEASSVDSDTQNALNTAVASLGSNSKIGSYVDITIEVATTENVLGNITQVGTPIQFSITIPEALRASSRQFHIFRFHNGVAEELESQLSGDSTILFSSDKFSTYVLAYTDPVQQPTTVVKEETEAPATYDDGGPFTTDAAGNVYDRWGNEIWHNPNPTVVASDTNNGVGYQLVSTSDKQPIGA